MSDKLDVYLVVVFLTPTQKQIEEEGAAPIIVVQPSAVMAKDENQAAMKAMKKVPDEYADKDNRLEVRVLPFTKVALGR